MKFHQEQKQTDVKNFSNEYVLMLPNLNLSSRK